MGRKIRVGVIGSGIGAHHIMGYQKCDGVEVLALADADEERGRSLAKEKNIPVFYTDYKDLLRLKELDAVSVCTPNYLHATMTIQALNHGKDVICEKPMAMNFNEACKMVKAAKSNKKILMIGLTHRFRNDSKVLKEFIRKDRLGEIYHVRAYAERRRGIPAPGSWFTDKSKAGGGALIDIGVHILDLCLWLMDEPQAVSVTAATYAKFITRKNYVYLHMWGKPKPKGKRDVDDLATAWCRFKSGATLVLETSWASNIEKDTFYAVILGDKGGARLEFGEPLKIYTEEEDKIVDLIPMYHENNPYEAEIEHFVECVRKRKNPISDGNAGARVQRLMDSIYLSARTKREIIIK